ALLVLRFPAGGPSIGLPSGLEGSACHWAEPNPSTDFGMNQPKELSAPKGGSIHIPFSFYYSWESAKVPNVRIFWRWKHYHGEFIYNTTPLFIHKDFKDRLLLNWTKGGHSGSLQISKLQWEDESRYFCRVEVDTLRQGKQTWQSIEGTALTVIPTAKPTTLGSTTPSIRVPDGKKSSELWSLSMETTVGLSLASAMLKIAILGWIMYLRWKRSKGKWSGTSNLSPGFPARCFSEPSCIRMIQVSIKNDDDIFYASLALSSLTSPAVPPHPPPQEGPQEETLYSVLKA
uniref:Immunoglobulin domain-containing protein n=1 Tax=Balaenoptera musculus TaxID=9771 RepID=A0A8C0D8J3_BALMU